MDLKTYHQMAWAHYHPPFDIDLNDPALVKFKFDYSNNKPVAGALIFGPEDAEQASKNGEKLIFLNHYTQEVYTDLDYWSLPDGLVSIAPGFKLHPEDIVGNRAGLVYGLPSRMYEEKDGKLKEIIFADGELDSKYSASDRKVIFRADSMSIIENDREAVFHRGDHVILQDGYLIAAPENVQRKAIPELPTFDTKELPLLPKITALGTNFLDPVPANAHGIKDIGLYKSENDAMNHTGDKAAKDIAFLSTLDLSQRHKELSRGGAIWSISSYYYFLRNAAKENLEKIDFRLTDLESEDLIQSFKKRAIFNNLPEDKFDQLNLHKIGYWHRQIFAMREFLWTDDLDKFNEESDAEDPSFRGDFSFTIPKVETANDVRQVREIIDFESTGLTPIVKSVSVNAMIETAAACENFEDILKVADKPIIGACDLTAALLKLDRGDEKAIAAFKAEHGYDPFKECMAPEVLEMICDLTQRSHAAGKPIAIAAAQLAQDPASTMTLMRAGVDELILPPDPAVLATARYARHLLAEELKAA